MNVQLCDVWIQLALLHGFFSCIISLWQQHTFCNTTTFSMQSDTVFFLQYRSCRNVMQKHSFFAGRELFNSLLQTARLHATLAFSFRLRMVSSCVDQDIEELVSEVVAHGETHRKKAGAALIQAYLQAFVIIFTRKGLNSLNASIPQWIASHSSSKFACYGFITNIMFVKKSNMLIPMASSVSDAVNWQLWGWFELLTNCVLMYISGAIKSTGSRTQQSVKSIM